MARQFVPATDEVWRLQHGDDVECKLFQQMANHGHYAPTNSTQQGIYVCSPSGKFLASVNSNDPARVLAMMRKGLAEWESLADEDRRLADKDKFETTARMESREPQNGLVLAMYARDLPGDCDPDSPRAQRWNRDTVWFARDEAQQFVPERPQVGQTFELPRVFVNRIVALHLVDIPNGQTKPFAKNEIRDSTIQGKVVAVSDSKVEIELEGSTRSNSIRTGHNQSPRGVVTRLIGNATFDLNRREFTEFEFLAIGRRWGFTPFNDRKRESRDSNPLGFYFTIADPDEPPNVPAFIWAYNAPWLNKR